MGQEFPTTRSILACIIWRARIYSYAESFLPLPKGEARGAGGAEGLSLWGCRGGGTKKTEG
jgi:hypothetical protein